MDATSEKPRGVVGANAYVFVVVKTHTSGP